MASFDKYSRATGIPDFWNGLVRNYGRRLMVMLLCFYLFIKGFIASAIGLSLLPFFKNDLRVNEKTYQIYSMVIKIIIKNKNILKRENNNKIAKIIKKAKKY